MKDMISSQQTAQKGQQDAQDWPKFKLSMYLYVERTITTFCEIFQNNAYRNLPFSFNPISHKHKIALNQ